MPDDKCKARHYLTRNVLICHREPGHEGMHRDSDQNLYWHPGAPPLDRSVLGSTDPHPADADSPTDQAGTFGAENHPNRTQEES